MAWASSGPVLNPVDGDIILDTGPLAAGAFALPIFVMTADSTRVLRLEYRNAANSANKQAQILLVSGTLVLDLKSASVTVLVNERFRVVVVGNILGRVQASTFT